MNVNSCNVVELVSFGAGEDWIPVKKFVADGTSSLENTSSVMVTKLPDIFLENMIHTCESLEDIATNQVLQ